MTDGSTAIWHWEDHLDNAKPDPDDLTDTCLPASQIQLSLSGLLESFKCNLLVRDRRHNNIPQLRDHLVRWDGGQEYDWDMSNR